MTNAIYVVPVFATSRCDAGYHISADTNYNLPTDRVHLVVADDRGRETAAPLSEGDWEQLRDRIDQMMHQKGWR